VAMTTHRSALGPFMSKAGDAVAVETTHDWLIHNI
jgi:hypothetical protein